MEEDADVIALRNLLPRKMFRGRAGLRECPPADGQQMYDDESGGTPVSGSASVRKLQREIFLRERKIIIPT